MNRRELLTTCLAAVGYTATGIASANANDDHLPVTVGWLRETGTPIGLLFTADDLDRGVLELAMRQKPDDTVTLVICGTEIKTRGRLLKVLAALKDA